jgi:hypothetical protein
MCERAAPIFRICESLSTFLGELNLFLDPSRK